MRSIVYCFTFFGSDSYRIQFAYIDHELLARDAEHIKKLRTFLRSVLAYNIEVHTLNKS